MIQLDVSGKRWNGHSQTVRYYAQQIIEFDQRKKTTSVDVGNPSFQAVVTHEPMGVAALIVPWNYPLLMAAWKARRNFVLAYFKVAPCLAAGCTCILKPSELTPLSAIELADVMDSVGLPKGVFNLVLGNGPDSGSPLSSHPGKASFCKRFNEQQMWPRLPLLAVFLLVLTSRLLVLPLSRKYL